ncbi:MAG: nucleoside-diphosphate kinase [Parcubacteria group bacterium]
MTYIYVTVFGVIQNNERGFVMRYSSGVIKPDGVARHLEEEIFDWMERSGFRVMIRKTLLLKQEDVRVLYEYCYDMPHYRELEKFLMSGPIVFYVVSSQEGAIESLNRLVGSTDPKSSLRETIRGRYGESVAHNVIHSTQNEQTLRKDLAHFLTKEQLLELFL